MTRRHSVLLGFVPVVVGIAITNIAPAAVPANGSVSDNSPRLGVELSVLNESPADIATAVSAPSDGADISSSETNQTRAALDSRQIECMAKVIVHEAGNQPIRGQIAVAQVIRTRVKDGRFGNTPCGVIKQRGQFFDVDSYHPSRTDKRWNTAVEIATDTLNNEGEEVVPGALFFNATSVGNTQRTRVAQIGGHVFYR